jgi:hypothetical protein
MSDPAPKPLPRVSAAKYRATQSAKVRFREKGSGEEGNVYQGQALIIPCKGCGSASSSPPASPIDAANTLA